MASLLSSTARCKMGQSKWHRILPVERSHPTVKSISSCSNLFGADYMCEGDDMLIVNENVMTPSDRAK